MSGESRVYAFDAYGTLLDVHSAVGRVALDPAIDKASLSALWRQKQLEYAFVHALMERYVDFWALTERALDFAVSATGSALHGGQRDGLLEAYRALDPYPEVGDVLEALRGAGHRLCVLSNAPPAMLEGGLGAAGLLGHFDDVLSVDGLKAYKTKAPVYGLVTERYGVSADRVSFQSSNAWDVAGASAFGFQVHWINRTGQPAEYPDHPPHAVLPDLGPLIESP
ncbi:MAG: haloacid dehalogenase type II [Pseudomonadota bacterium]